MSLRLFTSSVYCRYVIEPYFTYPNLMDVLANFLKTEQTQGIRREVILHGIRKTCMLYMLFCLKVIRVLGLLGALDPHKHTVRKGRTAYNSMGMPISKPTDKGSKAGNIG